MTKTELIEQLNNDIAQEWAAALQYIQHAAMLTGAEFQTIQKELLVHTNEEIQHSEQLTDLVTSLGGTVGIDVAEIKTDPDSRKMLEQDLAGEQGAIVRYKERIQQANELGEFGIAKIIADILVVEEEHERDLKMALGK